MLGKLLINTYGLSKVKKKVSETVLVLPVVSPFCRMKSLENLQKNSHFKGKYILIAHPWVTSLILLLSLMIFSK